MGKIREFIDDESGATAIEYAFIALMIGVAIIPAVTILGTKLGVTFTTAANKL